MLPKRHNGKRLTVDAVAVGVYIASQEVHIMRSFLYRLASLLGDMNSIKRGTVPQRVVRKAVWRAAGKFLNRLF